MSDAREAIRDLVQRAAVALDEERIDAWLDCFEPGGTYELRAYSPEIRRWTIWWQADRETLTQLLADIDQHVRDTARRRHLVSVTAIEADGRAARVRSNFAIYRTTPEGQSSLYMVGEYEDRLACQGDTWRFVEHRATVDTRMLDAFTHVPI